MSAGPDLEGFPMTVPRLASNAASRAHACDEAADLGQPLTLDAGFARSQRAALTESAVGTVGLEVETHLVDLAAPGDRVCWTRVEQVIEAALPVAAGSAVTVEPGGQLELSGAPADGIAAAVARLRHDVQAVRLALDGLQLGLAHTGAD